MEPTTTAVTCPSCGTAQQEEPESKHCESCGAELSSRTALDDPPGSSAGTSQREKTSRAWPTRSTKEAGSKTDAPEEAPAVHEDRWKPLEADKGLIRTKAKSPSNPDSSNGLQLYSVDSPPTSTQPAPESEVRPFAGPVSPKTDAPGEDLPTIQSMTPGEDEATPPIFDGSMADSGTGRNASTIDGDSPAFSGSPPDNHGEPSQPVPPDAFSPELSQSSPPPEIRHPVFWGNGKSLFGIFLVNTLLTLLTLGIYSFWGRVRVREFLHGQTSFAGARFAYHGTGKELLTGWVKAVVVFGLPYTFLSSLPIVFEGTSMLAANVLTGLLVLCFIPVAVVGAHRYRLSRTSLRNIRFSFRGQVRDYLKLWLKGTALTALTAGAYYPFFENARRHFLVSHSQFGTQAFEYQGRGKDLFVIYLKALGWYALAVGFLAAAAYAYLQFKGGSLATMPIGALSKGLLPLIGLAGLFIPWFYLQAARQRFFWNHTRFGHTRFASTVTAWKLFELRLGHLLLLLATFGLAWPWVQIRNLQFFYYYLGLQGAPDFQAVTQDAQDASPTGEELAGFFDAGFDLG